jgi:hypothetical protein
MSTGEGAAWVLGATTEIWEFCWARADWLRSTGREHDAAPDKARPGDGVVRQGDSSGWAEGATQEGQRRTLLSHLHFFLLLISVPVRGLDWR